MTYKLCHVTFSTISDDPESAMRVSKIYSVSPFENAIRNQSLTGRAYLIYKEKTRDTSKLPVVSEVIQRTVIESVSIDVHWKYVEELSCHFSRCHWRATNFLDLQRTVIILIIIYELEAKFPLIDILCFSHFSKTFFPPLLTFQPLSFNGR